MFPRGLNKVVESARLAFVPLQVRHPLTLTTSLVLDFTAYLPPDCYYAAR